MTRCVKRTLAVKIAYPLHRLMQGVFFMCRRYLLWGAAMAAFGFGLLIGMWIEGGFLAHCCGLALFVLGVGTLLKKQV